MNYKPGIQNNAVNSLSRFQKSSPDLDYGKICSKQEVKVIFNGSINQTNGRAGHGLWTPLVKKKDEEHQFFYHVTDRAIAFTTQDLVKAQKEESQFKRLFEIKSNGINVNKADTQKEAREVKVMLKDIGKL